MYKVGKNLITVKFLGLHLNGFKPFFVIGENKERIQLTKSNLLINHQISTDDFVIE